MKHLFTLLLLLAALSGYSQEDRRIKIQPLTEQEAAEFQKSAKDLRSSCGINKVMLIPETDVINCDANYDTETAYTIYVDPPSDNYEYSINNGGWHTKAQLDIQGGLIAGVFFVSVRHKNNPGCTVASEMITIIRRSPFVINDVKIKPLTDGAEITVSPGYRGNAHTLISQSGVMLTGENGVFKHVPVGVYTLTAAMPEDNSCTAYYPEKIRIYPPGVSVGSVAGSFDVSATGAATYTIPIAMPPGVGGMQPQVAITYNSQSGNGIAGWGCNLSGISAITRVPKSIYYDGKAQGLTYSSVFERKDGFAWNGQRLVNSLPPPGGNIYYPESDPDTKVSAISNGLNELSSWEVLTKDGTRYTYGKASGQHAYSIGNTTKVAAWYLERVENKLGNYITYEYEEDDTQIYLKTITYGKNKNEEASSQASTINMVYEPRPDPIPFMLETVKGSTRRRLVRILTKTGDFLYRKYALDYAKTDHFSRLVAVTESNGDGESFKPLELDWEYPTKSSQQCHLPTIEKTSVVINNTIHKPDFIDLYYLSADVNGDGISDLLSLTSLEGTNYVHVRQTFFNGQELGFPFWMIFNIGPDYSLGGITPIDFDGNGVNELMVPKAGIEDKTFSFKFISGVSSHFNNQVYTYKLKNSDEMPALATGDFNNDGKGDMLLIEKVPDASNQYPGEIITHVAGKQDARTTVSFTLNDKPEKILVNDFNGDGMNDILVLISTGYCIFWNNSGDFSSFPGHNLTNNFMVRMGDFNGDGLPDLLTNDTNDDKWYFFLNNGNGTFHKMLACTLDVYDQSFTGHDNDKFDCQVFDFNGDGKSDVVITKAMYRKKSDITGSWGEFDQTRSYWMCASASGYELVKVSSAISGDSHDAYGKFFVAGDFDGDGKTEMLNYGYNCYDGSDTERKWRWYKNPERTMNTGMLTSVTDGFGNETSIAYTTLADKNIYAQDYKQEQYPLINFTPPIPVVKSITTSSVDVTTTNYHYNGAKAHLQGKGFLGLNTIKATNTTTGTVNETGVQEWNTTYFTPQKTFAKKTVGGGTAESVAEYAFVPATGKNQTYHTHITKQTDKDLDGNIVTSTYKFNEDNNITGETTDYGGGISQTTIYSQYARAGGEMPYLPQEVEVIRKHPDDDKSYTTSNTVTYDTWNANPTSKTENGLSTSYISYDRFGNLTAYKITGSELHNPLTHYNKYDSTGRFIVEKYTSPASGVHKYKYDIWGNVLSVTDETEQANKLTTTYKHDGWGRKRLTTLPDSTVQKFDIGWEPEDGELNGRYYTYTEAQGKPWVKKHHDRNGRETVSESIGPKGMSISTTSKYNNQGQLIHITSQQGNLTTTESYTYDKRGRLKTRQGSNGQNIVYDYGNRKTTTTINGKTYIKTFDAWGGIKTAVDPTSSVVYTYKSIGKPWKITTDGMVFEMDYDIYGNRVKLIDPNTGTITYKYDALGRVRTQTDKQGMQQYDYDAQGRVTSVNLGGWDIPGIGYEYVASGNGKLQLERMKVSGAGSTAIEYSYDTYGRIITEKRGPIVTTYGYDRNGNITTIVHPGDVTVNREFDAYGYLTKVLAGTQTVWELDNATGIQTSARLGGSMTATTQYNSKGLLSELKTVKGAATLRNFGYDFNGTTGNLAFRTGMLPEKETFDYDGINRLTTVMHDDVLTMDIDYEVNGNIHKKLGLGIYDYVPNKPHAVEAIENTNGQIPQSNRTITYTTFKKISRIHEVVDQGYKLLDIGYGPDLQRWSSTYRDVNGNTSNVTYAGDYEKFTTPQGTREFYYIKGGDGLVAVYIKQNGNAGQLYYAHTDHLGSIVSLTDADGTPVFQAIYDAWGKQTITVNTIDFHRGYTGHEHLPEFGLINMNGRMYDPVIARFLSPDPFVQVPDFSQSFNRYSYCLNNPLVYTDPDGEKWWHWLLGDVLSGGLLSFTAVSTMTTVSALSMTFSSIVIPTDLTVSWVKGFDDPTAAGRRFQNTFKMVGGLFKTDENKGFWPRTWQLLSRHTWESVQTHTGLGYSSFRNMIGKVDRVDYLGGATFVTTENADNHDGVTLGNYINMNIRGRITGDFDTYATTVDPMYMHEYGHTIDSRLFGLSYLFTIGIPSAISAAKSKSIVGDPNNLWTHDVFWAEQSANRHAEKYFRKHYGVNWSSRLFNNYPLH